MLDTKSWLGRAGESTLFIRLMHSKEAGRNSVDLSRLIFHLNNFGMNVTTACSPSTTPLPPLVLLLLELMTWSRSTWVNLNDYLFGTILRRFVEGKMLQIRWLAPLFDCQNGRKENALWRLIYIKWSRLIWMLNGSLSEHNNHISTAVCAECE